MPLYDYKCREHGLFSELATMADSDQPLPCPSCGILSARVLLLPPSLALMSAHNRTAHARNEKSRFAPYTTCTRADPGHAHDHHEQPLRRVKFLYMADGSKLFPSMRPWMISH
jgi:putative FmdB family regulatory protein